jgi:ketosteroid isomerase-like protein
MMHDIISDILAADTVPREKKRDVIYAVLGELRDTTRNVMTRDEWLMMGHHMGGIVALGGRGGGRERPTEDTARVREVVEAVARFTQLKDIAGLDTLFAPDAWVRVIEGAGVNNGWTDYRDRHLRPELAEMGTFTYRFFAVEPHVRGAVAWTAFRYELTVDEAQGSTEIEGRGTAVLERRGNRWQLVQLHTSAPQATRALTGHIQPMGSFNRAAGS